MKLSFLSVHEDPYRDLTPACRCALTAFFRPPPSNDAEQYTPYVYAGTQHLLDQHTIPLMEDMFNELIALGK